MTPDLNDINHDWPKRPDGTRKTVGEMTPAEKVHVFRRAGEIAAQQMTTDTVMAERLILPRHAIH